MRVLPTRLWYAVAAAAFAGVLAFISVELVLTFLTDWRSNLGPTLAGVATAAVIWAVNRSRRRETDASEDR